MSRQSGSPLNRDDAALGPAREAPPIRERPLPPYAAF